MKKLLILLSIVTASASYSAIQTNLDVNATLIRPLTLVASTKELQGSTTITGGSVKLSTVDLLVTGMAGKDIKVIAPKDVTLYDQTAGSTQEVILQSNFSTAKTTTGTTIETVLTLDASTGEAKTIYHLEGTVQTGLNIVGGKAEFIGNTDVTVAYN